MTVGVYIFLQTVLLLVGVIDVAMLARMIVGWFTMGEQTKFGSFLYVVTEPIIWPVRALCAKFGWFQNLPFDMPFFLTSVLMMMLTIFLEAGLGL